MRFSGTNFPKPARPALTRSVAALAALLIASVAHAADWPRILGPADNCTTPETGLLKEFPATGLKVLWETEKGSGYGGPAIAGDTLVFFHRVEDEEIVEARNAATGVKKWRHAYPVEYTPRYGGGTGPKTSPVIAGNLVFSFGVTGELHAFDLASGKVAWRRSCSKDFGMPTGFFGGGATPLVHGDRLIVEVGGEIEGVAVNSVALELATGKLVWTAKHAWGAAYASPVPAKINGKSAILVFAGGESRPPTGGLLVINPEDGTVLSELPHRASIAESVNASTPVVTGENRVFISEAYGRGGVNVDLSGDFKAKPVWKSKKFGMLFMTPLSRDGCLFGFEGYSERLAELVCVDAATGKEVWRNDLGGGLGRGSLLQTGDGVLCLGEFGDLAWLEISPKGASVKARTKLFSAPETWTLPAVSNGRLYVCQNEQGNSDTKPRLICYEFRGK